MRVRNMPHIIDWLLLNHMEYVYLIERNINEIFMVFKLPVFRMNKSHSIIVPIDKVSCSDIHSRGDFIPFDDCCFEFSVDSKLIVQNFFKLKLSFENVLPLVSVLNTKIKVNVKVEVYASVCLDAFMDVIEKRVKSVIKVLLRMLISCCAYCIYDHWVRTGLRIQTHRGMKSIPPT